MIGDQFGLAKESVWGTAVTPTKFFEFETEGLTVDPTYSDSSGLRAGRTFMPSTRMRQTTRDAGGDVVLDVPTKNFDVILDLMNGLTNTPVQQGATIAYKNTFNIGTSLPTKSATLQVNKATRESTAKAFTYPGGVLTGVGFALDTAGTLRATTSWNSKDETTPDTTPSGAALAVASYATGSTNWVGTQVTTLTVNGVAVAIGQSLSINWAQPFKTDTYPLGSSATKAKPVPNGIAGVTGELAIEWNDTDDALYDLFRAGTKVAIVATLRGDLIATTYYDEITFTMSSVQLRGASPTSAGPDVASVSIPFVAGDDGTNPPLKIEYTNTNSTAP